MLETKLHRCVIVLVAAALAVGLAAAPAYAGKTVKTSGGDSVVINESLSSTLRFNPGVLYVRRGERVTWDDSDKTGDPHSITVARKKKLPVTIDEVFSCPICSLINAHFNDPNDPDSGIATLKVNRGPAGMQSEGDSLILLPGEKIGMRVKAKLGRRIHYFCAIHPWMQGTIRVTRSGKAPRQAH
jgi:plastocyanin